MTQVDARRLIDLAKKQGRQVKSKADLKQPNRRVLLIDGFVYDDPNLALADLLGLQAS